jgi:hypothetical protein
MATSTSSSLRDIGGRHHHRDGRDSRESRECDVEKPLSTEDLSRGEGEWRNIQLCIRKAFLEQSDTIHRWVTCGAVGTDLADDAVKMT